MCGFAGLLEMKPGAGRWDARTLARMGDAIAHRGPDADGVWLDRDAGIGLSHRRLAIVDLTEAGRQPMASASGRFVIAFNGEIYNHVEMRAKLEAAGRAPGWRGHSDTETLLAAIEAWGIERTLAESVGMFAFASWDRVERRLDLARDRMGEKPLYYGWIGEDFAFASELKALKVHPRWQGEVDRDALALYFRHSFIPGPYSIYRGIRKLLPGTRLAMGAADSRGYRLPEPVPYWSISALTARQAEQFSGDEQEALAELERLGRSAVALQRVADVPLGAFLSGGVDSSTVVALMQTDTQTPVRTFTIGFDEAGYNEAQHAAAVARHLGTDHTELTVTPEEARTVIPRLPTIYDEPFADPSQIPTFLVSALARRRVTVSLSGDGGDELFGGYDRYFFGRALHRRIGGIPLPLRKIASRTVKSVPPAVIDAALRPFGKLWPRIAVPHPSDRVLRGLDILTMPSDTEVYRRIVSQSADPTALVRGAKEPATLLDASIDARASVSSFEQWMMSADMQTYLPDDILVKVDRAAMAVSLETRVPFLDHRMVEFAVRLPLHMKMRGASGKWLLRQLLYKFVPRELVDRPKMGFGVPIDAWLRGPLREWADDLLDASRIRREGFLDAGRVTTLWTEHRARIRNWQYQLWSILMFQCWLAAEAPREHETTSSSAIPLGLATS